MGSALPSDFIYGASTAAYQIEGSVKADGRGASIWDSFSHTPGKTMGGATGDVACDHYSRHAEDIALMRALGLDGYRFSIAWPRVLPLGRGEVNEPGLDFYDRLVDELLDAGLAPMATLYHWDLPEALQNKGGWLARSTIEAFADYAAICGERLADRVAHWAPVNEPNVVTMLGHGIGKHAPGSALLYDALPVAHHLNLAHGRAVQALRAAGAASIGCANNHAPVWPDSDSDRDAAALFDLLWNRIHSEPMILGTYPEIVEAMLPVLDRDLATICQPLDFYGVNYYSPIQVKTAEGELPFEQCEVEGYPTTDFGWPVVPSGLTDYLVEHQRRYPSTPPVHITENGCSFAAIDDQFRIDYLSAHLDAVADAIDAGVDVRGYWTWSILDNFEWAEGYSQRFGLVHVDFDTQVRTPRASYTWLRERLAAR